MLAHLMNLNRCFGLSNRAIPMPRAVWNHRRAAAAEPLAVAHLPAAAPPQAPAMEACVLAVDDKADVCSLPSGQWLAAAPRGAYTTARTVAGSSVFELSFHVQRLASSAHLMLEADVREGRPNADALWAKHAATLGDPHWLRPRLLSSLRAAVHRYWQEAQEQQEEVEQQVVEAVAVGGSSDSSGASSSRAGGMPELKLTSLLTWDMEGAHIYSHVCALPPRPQPPVRVEVRGAPRHNAAAKDSEWVRQRKELEEMRGPGVNEVLLSSPDGLLYEGLSSNFFAVMDGAVHTADEGILAGSVRHLILSVAQREGLPVVLEPPRLADLDRWEGCFISSTSRLLLPVDEVLLPEHATAAWAPASAPTQQAVGAPLRKRFARGGLVSRLEQLVLQEVQANSEPLDA